MTGVGKTEVKREATAQKRVANFGLLLECHSHAFAITVLHVGKNYRGRYMQSAAIILSAAAA
jgi:hypothetical protein